MSKIERRNLFGQEARAEGEGESRRIVGYGAVFYRRGDPGTQYQLWSGAVERILPGAFDKTLKDDDIRGLFNHSPSLLLARNTSGTMQLGVDARGLRYDMQPGKTSTASDVIEYLDRGDVSGSSIGFRAVEVDWTEEEIEGVKIDVRNLIEIKLFDVGPVTFPAYTGTDAAMRSAQGLDEVRAEYDQRRDPKAAADRAARLRKLRIPA
ncbi:MAG: HK97 family phage prohead protease [Planctomycetota bacterium]